MNSYEIDLVKMGEAPLKVVIDATNEGEARRKAKAQYGGWRVSMVRKVS